ncbi:hypothetical protein AB1N83_004517 [Pleurotus pulmonarius]
MIAIPLDIVDLILQYLAEDIEALRECSLVHKFWVQPAQRLIFNKFTFHAHHDPDYSKCAQQAVILSSSPHLAIYIQHVEVHLGGTQGCDPLTGLLQRFINTRSLLFNSYIHARWTNLPTELRNSIGKMVALPTFACLNLWHWVFEPRQLDDLLMLCSRALRSLGLWSVIYPPCDRQEEARVVELCQLKELQIHGHASFPSCGTLKTPNLEVLERRLHDGRCHPSVPCRALLTPDIPSKTPTWGFYIYLCNCLDNEGCRAINFEDLVNLCHLRLTINCRLVETRLHRTTCISALGRILLGIPATHLKTVSINFICEPPYGISTTWCKEGWDEMATSLEPFFNASKVLDRVSLTIEDAHEESSTIMDLMGKRFEYLKQRLELKLNAL